MSLVVIVDGGPRREWNTAQLLDAVERGAREAAADVRRIRLYDLDVKDCYACMACKRVGSDTNGLCAVRDDLRPVLEACYDAEGIVLGSPVYYGSLTGQSHAFACRLMFPTMHYADDGFDPIQKKKRFGLVVTMNVDEKTMDRRGYRTRFDGLAQKAGGYLGKGETLYCCDTLQLDDYSKYHASMFDESAKRAHRKAQFPKDLQAAHELGKRVALGA